LDDDYNRDSINFNLNNYPFVNKNSKEYKDYQIGMDLLMVVKGKIWENEASNYRDKKLKEFHRITTTKPL
jgi:hypothetical protein